jgi:hypothetical protein
VHREGGENQMISRPPVAQALMTRFDQRALHYEVVDV